jgi:hypothetical protein
MVNAEIIDKYQLANAGQGTGPEAEPTEPAAAEPAGKDQEPVGGKEGQ